MRVAREERGEGAALARFCRARAARGRRPAARSAAHTESELTRLRHIDRAKQRQREKGVSLARVREDGEDVVVRWCI